MNFFLKILFFSVILILLLFQSCTTDSIKYTSWEGYFYLSSIKYKMMIIFNSETEISGRLQNTNDLTNVRFKGSYTLTESFTFNAKIKNAEPVFYDGDSVTERQEIFLSGVVDYFNGSGKGEFQSVIYNSTGPIQINSGNWEMVKI